MHRNDMLENIMEATKIAANGVFVEDALSTILPLSSFDGDTAVWNVSTSVAAQGETNLRSASYLKVGNIRFYEVVLSCWDDERIAFQVIDASQVMPLSSLYFRNGSGEEAAGQGLFVRENENTLSTDRDTNITGVNVVTLRFMAVV